MASKKDIRYDIPYVSCITWASTVWFYTNFRQKYFLEIRQSKAGVFSHLIKLRYRFCTIWHNTETRRYHLFHSNVVLLLCNSSTSHCLISSIWFTHDSLNVIMSGVQLWAVLDNSSWETKLRVSCCGSWTVLCARCAGAQFCRYERKQEGQHPLTGERAPPISGGT